MSEELKPCPFCGGEARVVFGSATTKDGHHTVFTVFCDECNAQGSSSYESLEEAVAVWNVRTEQTCSMEPIDGRNDVLRCSKCSEEFWFYDLVFYNDGTVEYDGDYCKSCGAKVVDE